MSRFGVSTAKELALLRRMDACGLREADLEEQFIRSGGAGGQKVNKSATCVQLRHLPTELEVKMQSARSQGLNRYQARRRLCELIEEATLGADSPAAKKQARLRKQKSRRRRRTQKKLETHETEGSAEAPGSELTE